MYIKIYYMFGFIFLVSLILIVTCSETTILLCYFHLAAEDYRWWWRRLVSIRSLSRFGAGLLYLLSQAIRQVQTRAMACLKEKKKLRAENIKICVGGPSQKFVLPIMLLWPAYACIIIPLHTTNLHHSTYNLILYGMVQVSGVQVV